ncbi:MAG: hypothetical protein JSR61_01455 [Proteobacteria bacterium]|nr:hypothetical protein [Pseudomonadota bacterium]
MADIHVAAIFHSHDRVAPRVRSSRAIKKQKPSLKKPAAQWVLSNDGEARERIIFRAITHVARDRDCDRGER